MDRLTLLAQAIGDEPAGGAALGEAVGAPAGAALATAAIAMLIAGHRSGRIKLLGRAAAFTERVSGLPGWAALPSFMLGISLLTAVLGMYWDISLHIDNGRDDGAFALSGFPLDDFWHRIFGQDVTLWGPTHLMLIGGGSLAVLGAMVLLSEAIGRLGHDPERDSRSRLVFALRRSLLVGGFLVALSTFQGEFDFGVPQFRQVLHPILIMLAAGIVLVAARVYLGRGGALQAVAGFVAIRGFLAIMVGGVWDQTLPHFPLYLAEALLVEAVFARARDQSPVVTGAIAGVFIGTIGLAAEWGWSHIWMPIPWQGTLLPEALIAGLVTAVAAGAVGGFVGAALTRPTAEVSGTGLSSARVRMGRTSHRAALAAFLALVAIVGWGLPISSEGPQRARVTLTNVSQGPEREVDAEVRIEPADGAEDAHFL